MKQDVKISLPLYKVIYSLMFAALLSWVRGIGEVSEIGPAIDANLALLTMIFCADTWQQEYAGRRSEVVRMLSRKAKSGMLARRMAVEMTWLLGTGMLCYGLFFLQKPLPSEGGAAMFGCAVAAFAGTILFWGCLSVFLTEVSGSMWVGIGLGLLLWLTVNSKFGSGLPDWLNVFGYGLQVTSEISWIFGKLTAAGAAVLLYLGGRQLIIKK